MTNEQFQNYVLQRLDKLLEEVTLLKGKSAVWGAVGGLIMSAIFSVTVYLITHQR